MTGEIPDPTLPPLNITCQHERDGELRPDGSDRCTICGAKFFTVPAVDAGIAMQRMENEYARRAAQYEHRLRNVIEQARAWKAKAKAAMVLLEVMTATAAAAATAVASAPATIETNARCTPVDTRDSRCPHCGDDFCIRRHEEER